MCWKQVRKDVDDCYAMAVALQQAAGESVETYLSVVEPDNPVAKKQTETDGRRMMKSHERMAFARRRQAMWESHRAQDYDGDWDSLMENVTSLDDLTLTLSDEGEEQEESESEEEYDCVIQPMLGKYHSLFKCSENTEYRDELETVNDIDFNRQEI